jgi:cell division protein FtsL
MTATAQPSARAAATATAPARRPDREAARPPLRVVQPGERQRRGRGRAPRHTRLLIFSTVLLAGMLLFGLVAAHVMLTQNQFRLEKTQRQAAEEQARYERLREQVAELESPGRIVAAAQERLGMVPPASVKYLTPLTPAPAGARTTTDDASTDANADQQAMTEWSVVKRHLSSRP